MKHTNSCSVMNSKLLKFWYYKVILMLPIRVRISKRKQWIVDRINFSYQTIDQDPKDAVFKSWIVDS